MRVAVTGGTGFIGRRLVPALAARGHEVTVLARHAVVAPGAARVIAADVARPDAIAALAGHDAIVHLAARSDASSSQADPVGYTTVNALGTLHVLEAARRHGASVVLASSQRVYEPWRGPLAEETTPLRPNTVYGYGKLVAETWTQMYHALYGVPSVTLRLFSVYGPGQRAGGGLSGIVAIFGERALTGRELVVHNRHLRDFVYVDDAAAAFALAVARARDPGVNGRVYNIGVGIGTPFDELARLVRERSGRGERVPVRVLETDEPREQVYATLDRARRELGFSPRVALPEGLDRYLVWLRGELAREAGGAA